MCRYDSIKSEYHIDIVTENDINYIFDVVIGANYVIYLNSEDIPYVSRIHIVGSKMILLFLDGNIREIKVPIRTIRVVDNRDVKRHNINIEGNLLRYDRDMAIKYNLDINKAESDNCIYKKKGR